MTTNQPPQALPKYCILCVDDDHIGLGLRSALLEDEAYFVTAVSCTFMALEYDVSRFHLAILDFDMPGLTGFQLLLRLRAAHASFPIVLLSSMSRELPNDMSIQFSSCLDKGEPIPILLNTIRSYVAPIPDLPECQVMGRDVRPPHREHRLERLCSIRILTLPRAWRTRPTRRISMWIVHIALDHPQTFIVLALLILILFPVVI